MIPSITYHDCGDRILMLVTRSATERETYWLPKPHTLGGDVERINWSTPTTGATGTKAPRRIATRRTGQPKRTAKPLCVHLGAVKRGDDGRVQTVKVLCATCQGNKQLDHAVHECDVYRRCLTTFRPTGEARDRWFGNAAKGIEPREESALFHLCQGCTAYQAAPAVIQLTALHPDQQHESTDPKPDRNA